MCHMRRRIHVLIVQNCYFAIVDVHRQVREGEDDGKKKNRGRECKILLH